ncbi:hypothetical protein GALL_356620 [mine drainage metagenome]|uniref:Uncharacterized protein n=1 Tax=mine drainage metagenome TaxID=410659 RepID=A0A1J5QGF7_9ZZZZ
MAQAAAAVQRQAQASAHSQFGAQQRRGPVELRQVGPGIDAQRRVGGDTPDSIAALQLDAGAGLRRAQAAEQHAATVEAAVVQLQLELQLFDGQRQRLRQRGQRQVAGVALQQQLAARLRTELDIPVARQQQRAAQHVAGHAEQRQQRPAVQPTQRAACRQHTIANAHAGEVECAVADAQ